ncbi:restriction endonuclease [Arthrobacter sp. CAN_C5]|uniref:restriction endonuclease n=1 Tax=Arthrobacter sp. CAN_C5 TaxID=2760706 RepID=UPI001FDA00DE|nr:restriction endonuclease [Arthrobacter sp. CAN_C5]MBP2216053.1 hypothetical protein [Arthrobacter sp. CAN_C5]
MNQPQSDALDREVMQVAALALQQGWSTLRPNPKGPGPLYMDLPSKSGQIALDAWPKYRAEQIYPPPGLIPPEPLAPSVSGIHFLLGAPVVILGGTIYYASVSSGGGDATQAVTILGLIYVALGILAAILQSAYESRLSHYWVKHDPFRKQRRDLQKNLESYLNRSLLTAAEEYGRPVATIEPDMVAKAPRQPLPYSPQSGRPQPLLSCTPRQAEYLARDWMAFLGATGAKASQATRDGGIDVVADRFVAEVKHRAVPSSPDLIRQIFGAATAEQKAALFFSLGGYTSEAVAFANKTGVALFAYSPEGGTISAKSTAARKALKEGLNALL